jgi:ankyrin repeat protein
MKTRSFLLLASMLVFASACNNKNADSGEDHTQAEAIEKTVQAPSTDLHTATFLGDMDAIHQHIAAGSDLNVKEPTMGSTPLISAAVFGKTDVARALIEAGADVNLQNNEGTTALHSAAFLCRTEIVEMLLANGADKSLQNIYGSTPLASVSGPFSQVKEIYDEFSKNLGPLGLKLDYDQIEKTRPVIADLLK